MPRPRACSRPEGGQKRLCRGTFDPSARILFLRDSIAQTGLKVVDRRSLNLRCAALRRRKIQPGEVAAHHPNGADGGLYLGSRLGG